MTVEITTSTGTTGELRWGAATTVGRIRPGNEDSYLARDDVFVVADGMGGHQAGEVASEIATTTFERRLTDGARTSGVVVAATIEANAAIFQAASQDHALRGMGTTVTAVVRMRPHHIETVAAVATETENATGASEATTDAGSADAPVATDEPTAEPSTEAPPEPEPDPDARLVVVNVGDSRTYLARGGRLKRVTIDHSYVQELVTTGYITEAEARHHPRRNIVTRALGIEPNVRVDSWVLPMVRGDRFVLCSDGLVDEVDDDEITAIVIANADPEACARELVATANLNGGHDNTTVIVLDVIAGQEPRGADDDLTGELDRAVPTWDTDLPLLADDSPPMGAATDTLVGTGANANASANASGTAGTAAGAGTGDSNSPAPTGDYTTAIPHVAPADDTTTRRLTPGVVLFALAVLAIIVGVVIGIIVKANDNDTPSTPVISVSVVPPTGAPTSDTPSTDTDTTNTGVSTTSTTSTTIPTTSPTSTSTAPGVSTPSG